MSNDQGTPASRRLITDLKTPEWPGLKSWSAGYMSADDMHVAYRRWDISLGTGLPPDPEEAFCAGIRFAEDYYRKFK